MDEYVFKVGDRNIIIEATSEKAALKKLIETKWDVIDEAGNIEMMGKIVEKYKVGEEPNEDE